MTSINETTLTVPTENIGHYPGLTDEINKFLGTFPCKNTLMHYCDTDKNQTCKVILHSSNGFTLKTQIDGLITIKSREYRKGKYIEEIFNFCGMSELIATELLTSAIVNRVTNALLWTAIDTTSPYWDKLLKVVAALGFKHPVILEKSPSGIELSNNFVAFYRLDDDIPSEDEILTVIDAANELMNFIVITPSKNSFYKRIGITRKKWPQLDSIYSPEVCMSGYELDKYLSEGTYGIVYGACTDGNCKYVIKAQLIESSDAMKDWKNEIKLIRILNARGIGSKLIKAWVCDEGNSKIAFFAAEKWDGDMNEGECPPAHIHEKLNEQRNIIRDLGYVHGDILPKNILVKRDSKKNIIDATISDFGTVDTIENWKAKPEWIQTFYEYQLKHSYMKYYYDKHGVTLRNVLNDPTHLDNALLYYFYHKCF